MKNKDFKYMTFKLFCSICGWLNVVKNKRKNFYSAQYPYTIFMHVKGRTFLRQNQVSVNGLTYFDMDKEKIPYWKIKILNFKVA